MKLGRLLSSPPPMKLGRPLSCCSCCARRQLRLLRLRLRGWLLLLLLLLLLLRLLLLRLKGLMGGCPSKECERFTRRLWREPNDSGAAAAGADMGSPTPGPPPPIAAQGSASSPPFSVDVVRDQFVSIETLASRASIDGAPCE